jgi:adenylate cyclase
MNKFIEMIFGKKIKNTRIIPLVLKIITIFVIFILLSNFVTNYINLMFNRSELIKSMKQLLVKDLKDIYNYSNNQFEIYQFNNDLNGSISNIEKKSANDFKNKKSVAFGLNPDGSLFFQSLKFHKMERFTDIKALYKMLKNREKHVLDGTIDFKINNEDYFGVYKYNANWDIYIVRGEELGEFYSDSVRIFRDISIIIIIITIICSVIGIFLISYILRFIGVITESIMKMITDQKLDMIDLSKAPNDDVSLLGVAFNSLSGTINNLMGIFLKFVNRDIASKVYKDKIIKLEGNKNNLTILFSDIKSFTFMTETLGVDIIKLLNIHYENAIYHVLDNDGVIASIIGNEMFAVYGSVDESKENKSISAIYSAYKIQKETADLRMSMGKAREELEQQNGKFSEEEEEIYKAVLIEVGVGIDCGDVFYGNVGSNQKMTNTVIGDSVKSALRLEELTRVYKVPVICSEYVKEDVEKNNAGGIIRFIEIDKIYIEGKAKGQKIFWPILELNITGEMEESLILFTEGLSFYYKGEWKNALKLFEICNLPLVDVFKDRLSNECPADWNGIWKMTIK